MALINCSWDPFLSSIFSEITELALREGAINLAQGFPDFDAPSFLKEAAIASIENGQNQYAPAFGLIPLRQAIAKRHLENLGLQYDPLKEVTVVSGGTEGIFVTLQALCNTGDEVIVFEPFYDSYPAAIHAAHAAMKVIPIDLKDPLMGFDPIKLRELITPATKAIFINTPHNPTGKIFSKEELQIIADIAQEHDLWVIADEVYDELYFSPHKHKSIATIEGMKERTVLITSASKTFSITGWKVGFVTAPFEVTKRIRAVHQYNVFCSATPLQWGVLKALEHGHSYYQEFRQSYFKKCRMLFEILSECGFKCVEPQGTYFILADYSSISQEDDMSFAYRMAREVKVAAIPVSVFFQDPAQARKKHRYVRIAFCKKEETLRAAGNKLKEFFKKTKNLS